MGNMDLPVGKLTGIGTVKADAFAKLGIFTLRDLLWHFPTRYENRGFVSPLAEGTVNLPQSYLLTVSDVPKTARLRGQMTLTKFHAFDDSGSVEVAYFNTPYVKDKFHPGETYRFYGRLTEKLGRYSLNNPTAEPVRPNSALPELYAVYRLSPPLNKNVLRACEKQAIALCRGEFCDFLPPDLRRAYHLADTAFSIENIHDPASPEALSRAARRIAFDELFEAAIAVRIMHDRVGRAMAARMPHTDLAPFLASLPFALTGAQKAAIADVANDLSAGSGHDAPRMSRILVGDVGCGKTVCAAAALYIAMQNGYQTMLMAPTEILAAQHFEELAPMMAKFGFRTEKLTGSTTAAEKRRIKAGLADGSVDLVIGTHALIEDDVTFRSLGLAVCDEQHRFGIGQRASLLAHSPRAHLLVMTATPIPRTLSLVLYGDLAISRIGEMPPGRQKVGTYFVNESYRARLNGFIEKQIAEGGQVYVVCPAVEPPEDDADDGARTVGFFGAEEEALPMKSAVAFAEELQSAFPTHTVACIHGKLRPAEKNDIMTRFAAGEIRILVATTVIEVGINVPNATLMIVENAERFGLSQLHQLRGRVGRGKRQSYCVLVSDSKTEKAQTRLRLLCKTNDGFAIAEEDLRMRGPGDFLATEGARQSGDGAQFRMAALCGDPTLPEIAGEAASRLLAESPDLAGEALAPLRTRLKTILAAADTGMN